MHYNIQPGACPEQVLNPGVPSTNTTWSALWDAPIIINAFTAGQPPGTTPGSLVSDWSFTLNSGTTYMNVVQDSAASVGFAVQWIVPSGSGPEGGPFVQFNNFGAITGGTYVVSLRLRSTIGPQAGATMSVNIKSALSSNPHYTYTNVFDISGVGNTYQTLTWTPPTLVSYNDSFTFTFNINSGFAGLIVDYIRIDQTASLADSTQITDRGLSGWVASDPPPVTNTPNIWHGTGLYHEYWDVESAAGSTPITDSAWYCNLGARGFNTGVTLSTPAIMTNYSLIILNNIDARTFYYDARDWLRGYVNAGGSLLMLGGVYSCGRGFWQGSDVASLLFPCTFSPCDLQPPTGPQVVQLNTGGIYSSTLSDPPVSFWNHVVSPNGGATVQATVGSNPAIVTWTYGAGKAAVVTLTPLGVGTNPWWEYGPWATDVMQPLINWLLPSGSPSMDFSISGNSQYLDLILC